MSLPRSAQPRSLQIYSISRISTTTISLCPTELNHVESRGVLVGDASRRINPLAGQGLNQGFRDVGALIACLDQALATGQDIGSDLVLAQFSQARRLDGHLTALALDGLDRLFSNDHMLTKPLRGIGMFAAQNIPSVRKFLARKASATEAGVPDNMRGW